MPGGEQVIAVYQYAHISSGTTTAVKTTPGVLHSITINKPVASEVWTIYDSLAGSGAVIGVITLPGTLLAQGPYTALYDVEFGIGLTIVSSGTTDGTVAFA